MNRRPFVTATAAAAVLGLCASAGSAGAATTSRPAAGWAVSNLSLLQLAAAGHTLRLADVTLLADTVSSTARSTIEVVPVTADGTQVGKQVITPGSGSRTVAPVSSPGALAAIAKITSPAIEAAATSKPSSRAGTTSLGSVNLFGLPISMAGAIGADSGVTAGSGAAGRKTVTLRDVALPSIADLLGKLGLDVGALPVGTLEDLIDQLDLGTGAITTAQDVVDQAQEELDAAAADLATQTAALSAADGALTAATASLASATDALQALLDSLPVPMTVADYVALVDKTAVDELVAGLPAAYEDYLAAQTAAEGAEAAVDAAQALVDAAQDQVDALTSTLDDVIGTLMGLLEGVLDDTPVLSLAKLSVTTLASAKSASKGGQTAKVVGGEVSGLKVLGTDVLKTVLGSSSVQLTDLVGGALTQVNEAIAELNGTLGSVLSSVPEFPALEVPSPVVRLLAKSTSTSVVDGFGKAAASLKGLAVSIPGITVPAGLQVPGAASLPGLSSGAGGALVGTPVGLDLVSISEQAAFRPAVVATGSNGGPAPELPNTGAPAGLTVVALLLAAGGVIVHRRFVTAA